MRLYETLMSLFLAPTTLASSALANTTSPLKCDGTAFSAFIPSNATHPKNDFQQYLQQPVCTAPPILFGLEAKNRFEEDYQRFAKFFNKNYLSVPKVCKARFEEVKKHKKIPKKWDVYERKEKKKCKARVEEQVQDGEGYKKYASAGYGGSEEHVKHAVVVALVIQVLLFVMA